MSKSLKSGLSIGEVVRATGVGEATLRAWERRFGFPAPYRAAGGHRRYSVDEVERIARVVADRERGLALPAAIARARGARTPVRSMFASLREARPDLQPVKVMKRHLLELTRAVEDESCARAERPVLLGSFQRERFYRLSERRWHEFARGSAGSVVLADFKRLRRPRGAPVEVPIERSHPALREWALVCDAPEHGACLLAWEPPPRSSVADNERPFDLVLSFEPSVVRAVLEAGLDVVAPTAPDTATTLRERLPDGPPPPTATQLRLASSVTARLLAGLG